MTTNLAELLDSTLEQLQAGEPLPDILVSFPTQSEVLEPLLSTAAMLETIRPVVMPTPDALHSDRNEFLSKIPRLQPQAVSTGTPERLKTWFFHFFSWQIPYYRKEQRRMSPLLIKLALVFSLLFSSVGGTVVMAAGSLPGSPVYALKQMIEQARLAITPDPADKAALHLSLAQVRVREMVQLSLAGEVPGEATFTQLQLHLNQALHLAAQTPAEVMPGLLTQTRQMIQTQEQQLKQTQVHVAAPAQKALRQASGLLNQAGQDVEVGLQDPQAFRWRHTENRPAAAPLQPTLEPAVGPNESGGNPDAPCDMRDCEPAGDVHRYGQETSEPQPGSGQPGGNPDGCETGDCEPAGDQHQHQSGATPNQTGPDEPGDNCDTGDCEPEGDEHHSSWRDDDEHQNGPGEPGGNPDGCNTDDCEPEGDQHQPESQPEPASPDPQPAPNPDPQPEPANPDPQPVPNPDPEPSQSNADADGSGTDDGNNGGGGDNGGGDDSGGGNGGGGKND